MVIKSSGSLLHWNYFLALEADLDTLSRYIEFDPKNDEVFSIELAHLLLASSSETDVVLKKLCLQLDPYQKPKKIYQYMEIVCAYLPEMADEEVFISRFGRSTKPWINFKTNEVPFWWTSYNKVKHQRGEHFPQANLRNVINSIGALLVANFYLYRFLLQLNSLNDVGHKLRPASKLASLRQEYYPVLLSIN